MNETEWLVEWFRNRDEDVTFGIDEHYVENGALDSFGVVELIEGVEQNFSIQMDEQVFQDPNFFTIKGLAEIIAKKRTGT